MREHRFATLWAQPHRPEPWFAQRERHSGGWTPERGEIGVGSPRNEEGAEARALWLEPGGEPQAADPPDDLPREEHVRLAERRVVARSRLALPDDRGAGGRLGLGPGEAEAYEEIAGELRHPDGWDPDDWVLGAVSGVQGHPPEDGMTLLLHLGTIPFLDGGNIRILVPDDALPARDWSRIVAEGDSS